MKMNRKWMKRAAMLSAMAACALGAQSTFAAKDDAATGADVHLEDAASLKPTPMPRVKATPKSGADTYEATGDLGITMSHGQTITLHFDINKAYTRITSARLVMHMWDVDYPSATEQDNVYFNGTYLGRLEGLNNGWDYNYFDVPISKITVPSSGESSSRNTVTIEVSVNPSGWVTRCGSAQLIINGDTFSLTASRNLAGGISVNWDNVYGSYDLWRKGPNDSEFIRIRQGITTNGCFDTDVQIGKPYTYYAIQSGAKSGGAKDATPDGASNTDEGLAGATDKPTIMDVEFASPMVLSTHNISAYAVDCNKFDVWITFGNVESCDVSKFKVKVVGTKCRPGNKTIECSDFTVGEKLQLSKTQWRCRLTASSSNFSPRLVLEDRGYYNFVFAVNSDGGNTFDMASGKTMDGLIYFYREDEVDVANEKWPSWAKFWKKDGAFVNVAGNDYKFRNMDSFGLSKREEIFVSKYTIRKRNVRKLVYRYDDLQKRSPEEIQGSTLETDQVNKDAIEDVAVTLAHESKHRDVYRTYFLGRGPYGDTYKLWNVGLTANHRDSDRVKGMRLYSPDGSLHGICDSLTDGFEEFLNNKYNYRLDKDYVDTYNIGSGNNDYQAYGDNEFLARKAGLAQMNKAHCGVDPTLDFAYPGLQMERWQTKRASAKDMSVKSLVKDTKEVDEETVGGVLAEWPTFDDEISNDAPVLFSPNGSGVLLDSSAPSGASALRFNVRVTCNTNEWQAITNYSMEVRGYLADKNGEPVAWTVSDITFTNKSVDVALDFAGEYIYAHRGSGYSLKYVSLALAGIDIDMVAAVGVDVASTVEDISADAFVGKHFFLTDFHENVAAKNLKVHFNAEVKESGVYTFKGHLAKSGTSETVADAVTVVTNLVSGATIFPVELSFPGQQIYLSGVDGTYSLSFLTVSRDDTAITAKCDVYELTNEYNHLDFKVLDSSLSLVNGSASFGTPATASDGFLGALPFSVAINNSGSSGKFHVTAVLEEAYSNKQYVASYVGQKEFTNGFNQVSLSFSSGDIKASGIDGPYSVRSIRVESVSDPSVVEVFRPDVVTGEYKADDFGKSPVELIGTPVVNTSGSAPVVTLSVEGLRDCIYNASAVLLDSNREFVAYVVTTNTIAAGVTNTVTMAFDEAVIIASGHRGPYILDYVMLEPQNGADAAKLYSGAAVSDIDYTVADAYVDAVNGSDSNGGTSWSDAYQSIQAAVNVSMSGDTILVADGTYAPFQTGNKEITIMSRHGAASTIIDAGRSRANCVVAGTETSHTNTIVSGFTLKGATGYVTQYGRFYNCITCDNYQGPYYGEFYNCTIADADQYIAYNSSFYNSIVWATDHNNGIYCSSSSKYYNSCLQYNFDNGTGSNNLIGVNPKFLDAANRDYRLLPGSPCVDAGANDYVFGSVAALGDNRIQNDIVDIGAFEGAVQVEAYNGFKYIKKLNGDVLIVGWNEDLPADVVIPDKIDGGRVVEICAGAFSNCTAMTSIDFGTNAVYCRDNAFYGCNRLTAVHVDNIRVWLDMVFDSDNGYSSSATPLYYARRLYVAGELLQSLVVPNGIDSISGYAFYCCNSITNLDLGGVKNVASSAFKSCNGLVNVDLRGVINLANYAFDSCSALRTVANDGHLRRIDFGAFEWCYALTSFKFNDGLEYVGGQAFLHDSLLKLDSLPDSIASIGWNAFRDTSTEGDLWLPARLTTLGSTSFEGCSKLTNVVIPNGVSIVNGWTFRNCTSMRSVAIPASVTRMAGDYELADCSKLNAVYYEGNAPTVTSTNLYYGSFSVTNYVRYGSSGWGNTGYWQERPVRIVPFLYDVDNAGNAIITGYVGAVIGALEIPGVLFGHRVVAIGDRAFEWQDQMTSVVIPEGVISIGEGAFIDCLALESITLPQTLKEIGRFAFAACWSLDNITIPASVTDILGSAFRGCQDLASVSFMGDAPNIDSAAFFGINTVITFIVPEGASGWDTYEGTYNIEGRAPLEFVTAALPEAMEMVEYSTQLEAIGGTPPYSWSCPARGYTVTTNSTSTFAEVGAAKGWHADDNCWSLALPFDFPFYGNKYRTAYITSNGTITFDGYFDNCSYSIQNFTNRVMIAALWSDLDTSYGGDIYVSANSDAVTIRWVCQYHGGGGSAAASATLYANGTIRLAYGNGNAKGGFVGVSAGDGLRYIPLGSEMSLNAAQDILLRSRGIADGLFVSEEGQITGIPTTSGVNTFTVTVTDAVGDVEEKELSIVVNENPNHKPEIDSVSPTTNIYVKVGDSATFAVTAHDPEGAALEYVWYLDGDEIECVANRYTFAATLDDAGAHTLECVVSDGLWTDMVRHRWSFRVVRDWYVDASAEDDSGDGASSASALYSISEALGYAEDGDTIYVAPGTYEDYLEFYSDRTVSIVATGGASCTFFTGEVDGYDTEWFLGEAVVQSTMRGFTFRGCDLGGITLDDCVLTCDETGCYSSEAYGCRLFDCSVTGNTSDDSPIEQCELTRCTVAGNTVGEYGAVGYSSYVYDCIVWDNVTVNGETSNYDTETRYDEWWDDDAEEYVSEEYAEVHIFNSCTWPMPSEIAGTDNITSDPRLVDAVNGDLRLRIGSPCLVGGVQAMGVYLGDPVAGFVLSVRIEGSGAVSPMTAVVSNGGNATFEVADNTRPFLGFSTNGVFATVADTLTWQGVKSDGIITAVFSNFTFYVDAAAGDDANDGLSWATARASIQSAINDAVRGETIYVKAGTYDPIVVGAAMRLRIESVDGKEATVIDGGGERQCANLGGDDSFSSTLVGFTLTNGYSSYGGGAHGGTLVDCDVMGNYARYQGGGLYYSTAIRCQISDNKAGDTNLWSNANGGGAYSGTLRNCLVVGNTAESSNYCEGGASCYSALYNCTVVDNVARGNGYGGGVVYGNLYNSVVFGNHADYDDETQYVWTMQKSLIGVDPGFIDAENGDYRLAVGSPCIDAGSNGYVLDDADLDGNERIQHYTVDIGCYEYELATPERDADADFAEQMAGTCYGVFVGVGQYTYTSSLTGPTIDATNMQTRCVDKGYWRDENTFTLLDTAATKSVVRARLATLAAKAVSGDTVLYYQSSHGGSHTSGGYDTKDTYICLHDATYEDYEMAEDLMQFAAGVKVVIVLDTCHSAGMFKAMGESSPASAKSFALRVRELMAERAALRKGVKSGITTDDIGWIAAADYNQYSYDSPQGGAFTVALLDGWKTGAADYDGDKRLNFHELWRYAKGIAVGYGGSDASDAQCLNEDVLLSRFAGTPDSSGNGNTTETTPAPVEHVWLDAYPEVLAAFGGDYEAMASAPSPGASGGGKTWPDGSPCYVWQDFVAGTSPTNDTVFTAKIRMEGNTPVVTWEPDTPELRATRVYRTLGKKTLLDANWTDITDKDQSEYHFFRVTVDMP